MKQLVANTLKNTDKEQKKLLVVSSLIDNHFIDIQFIKKIAIERKEIFNLDNNSILTKKIDYVEVGERNGLHNNQDVGLVTTCPKPYLDYCRQNLTNSKMTVMIHPHNIYSNDFVEMNSAKVNAINIYFDYQHPFITFKVIEELQAYNFELFVTLSKVSKLCLEKLDEYVNNLAKVGVTNIFLCDLLIKSLV